MTLNCGVLEETLLALFMFFYSYLCLINDKDEIVQIALIASPQILYFLKGKQIRNITE